jgi:hypothetical protein
MATYSANSVPITPLSFFGLSSQEAGLIDGTKWGAGGYGHGVALTYSFPWVDGAPAYSGYGGFGGEWVSAPNPDYALNFNERSAVRDVLLDIELAADIAFVETEDTTTTVGELRFTETNESNYAHAYLPEGNAVRSGDVWFSHRYWNPGTDADPSGPPVKAGSYEYMTIIHEVGHALGLKHPFERGASGVRLPPESDNYLWTVMSYSAYADAGPDVWANFYPTTLMYLDLVALEKMYGPAIDANSGNTEYVYRQDMRYWETISDSGGIDTIIYEASSDGCLIDLSNEDFSRMGKPIHFSDGTTTRDTICMGPSTIIENATGGGGDDRLIGNRNANRLIGNGGSDQLTGGAGADNLNGGSGKDRLNGGAGNDTMSWTAGDRYDGGDGHDVLKLSKTGLDLTRVGQTHILNVETISMKGAGDNLLTLAARDVLDISSTTNTLKVLGETGDSVNILDDFDVGETSRGFTTYTIGSARLLVDRDVDVA